LDFEPVASFPQHSKKNRGRQAERQNATGPNLAQRFAGMLQKFGPGLAAFSSGRLESAGAGAHHLAESERSKLPATTAQVFGRGY